MTDNLRSRLVPGATSGIYRLEGRTSAKTLARLTEAVGWHFIHLAARQVGDKGAFLVAAARDLQFPEWAGHNWDAFEELVSDLSWLPAAHGYLLLLDGMSKYAGRQAEDVRIALDILQNVVAKRQEAGEDPLVILVRGAGWAARRLPALTAERDTATTSEQNDA